jgi:iron complex transport system substrate-binding protein
MTKIDFRAMAVRFRPYRICGLLLLASALTAEPAAALRIVSIAPSVTETLFAIDAGDEVVGISAQCDYPPEVAGVDRVGTFLKPNMEAILAKRPDIVIAAPSPTNAPFLDKLQRLGIEVLLVESNSVRETVTNIVRIADAVGREAAGHALARRIERDIATTRRRLAGATPRRVLLVLGQKPFVAAGAGGLQDELIRIAGGVNVAASGVGRWPRLSLEHVIAQRPEVIVDMTIPHETAPSTTAIGMWSAFPIVPAVRLGRVYGHPPPLLVRPGPRVAKAIDLLARYVHPERFETAVSNARRFETRHHLEPVIDELGSRPGKT